MEYFSIYIAVVLGLAAVAACVVSISREEPKAEESFIPELQPPRHPSLKSMPNISISTPKSFSAGYEEDFEDELFEEEFAAEFSHVTDKKFHTKVVGTSFHNDDGSNRCKIISSCEPMDYLTLRMEPDNPNDPNAIAVLRADGQQLGYLQKRLAGEITRDVTKHGREWRAVFKKATHKENGEVAGAVISIVRMFY